MRAGALAAAVLAGASLLLAPAAADRAREAATDVLMRLAPRPEHRHAPVVAVAVGEADLAELGPWPWPRGRVADLVTRLAEAGAAAVGLDIVFVEAAPADAELAEALAASPAVLGFLAGAAPPPRGFAVAQVGAPDLPGLLALPGATPLAVEGAPAALAALPGDTVRAAPMLARLGETLVPGLAVGVLARALEVETLVLRGGGNGGRGSAQLQLGGVGLPLPPDGLLRLHPPRAGIAVLPAAEVLAGRVPAALRGRLVLVGSTAAEVAPLRPSPLGSFTPSLLLHAAAVEQLTAGWVPVRVPGGAWTEAGAALLLGALAAAAVARRPGGPGMAAAALLALLWPAAAAAALRFGPVLLDPALPAAAALLGGAAQAAAAARRLARERAQLLDRFAHRVPAGLVDRLLAMPAAERLRPEKLRVTVVMTDLSGFSAMVRRSDPAAVVSALNAYLAGVEVLVAEHGGTLERLLGDGALAVFGAPVAQPDHAARALAAARAIDRFAEDFRRRPEAAALGWGTTRIGVAAGEVMAGELGGSRLTWMVCGDAANTAARMQELARELGVRALATGVEDPSLPPPLGRYALRGLPGEVAVHPL